MRHSERRRDVCFPLHLCGGNPRLYAGACRGARTRLPAQPPLPALSSAGDLMADGSSGHTGFTGTSLWVDAESGLWGVLLTNAVHFGRDKPRSSACAVFIPPWRRDRAGGGEVRSYCPAVSFSKVTSILLTSAPSSARMRMYFTPSMMRVSTSSARSGLTRITTSGVSTSNLRVSTDCGG